MILCPECGKNLDAHTLREEVECFHEIIRTRFAGQMTCRECGRELDAHTKLEELDCALKQRDEVYKLPCPTCGRRMGEHSRKEIVACSRSGRNQPFSQKS